MNNPQQRLPLHLRFLVDGGYVSWIYGSSTHRYQSWVNSGRKTFIRSHGAIFIMDHPVNARRQFTETYKEKRVTRKMEDPDWIKKTALVEHFKAEFLMEDPSLDLLQCPGCEADDLIAAFISEHCLPEPLRVVGVDKDLLQLGDWDTFQMIRMTRERMTISKYVTRLPIQVQPWIRQPEHILMALILLGDKSDSIARLIPPRELELFVQVLQAASPWKKAQSLFGEAFLTNLYLAILPGPFCYRVDPSPKDIYRRLLAGRPTFRLYDSLRPEITEMVKQVSQ